MITLNIMDEIVGKIDGLTDEHIGRIIERTGYMEPGAFITAAFKVGMWDGKTSLFRQDGLFYLNMLDDVIDILDEEFAIQSDDFELNDMRLDMKHDADLMRSTTITKDYFRQYGFPHDLYDHQLTGINAILHNERGIIEVGTSGGKSGIMAGCIKLYEPHYRSLTITKDSKLCKQLKAEYAEFGVDATIVDATTPSKKRGDKIANAQHIITTKKLASNMTEHLDGFCGVWLCDEVHEFGEQFQEFIVNCLGDCPIRVGLTGTLPEKAKDPLKRARILAHIGGDAFSDDTLIDVNVGELLAKGHVSDFTVEMVEIEDVLGQMLVVEIGVENWEWAHEKTHLDKCEERFEAIITAIDERWDGKNALILCKPEAGKYISQALDLDFIDNNTPPKLREEYYKKFQERDDYPLVATIETTGTGISINEIYNVFLIDVGANPRYIGQGIGRGLRKDGVYDKINVVDIYTNTLLSKKQEKRRIRYYKKKGYPFFKSQLKLRVE